MRHTTATLSPLAALLLASAASAQQYQGDWQPPFDHDLAGFDPPPPPDAFNAIHLALIPTGPHRGKVFAMDQDVHVEKQGDSDEVWEQRWSILDFTDGAPPVFQNHVLKLPDDKGDLFCSGHAWMPDGRLFVAGGSTQYLPSFVGGKLCLTWDPLVDGNDAWVLQPELNELRWYPTVTVDGQDRIIVSGGTPSSGSHAHNSFEVLDTVAGAWNLVPAPSQMEVFSIYPRQHLLSSGHLFVAGFSEWSAKYSPTGAWIPGAKSSTNRQYGSSVILRIPSAPDIVAILGGRDDTVLDTVEWCFAGSSTAAPWNPAPPLHRAREMQNAVVLPDGSILVVGGEKDPPHPYVQVPELYKDSQWHEQPQHVSPRDYHSTALLLPDGRVLSAAGDKRTWDYQIFRPHYLTSGEERPVITDAPVDLEYLSDSPVIRHITIAPMTTGTAATVVLLRPGSVTHHNDYDQRYVVLPSGNGTATGIDFGAPLSSNDAPRGFYMLFVVSNAGIPSEAAWVNLQ